MVVKCDDRGVLVAARLRGGETAMYVVVCHR